MKQLFRIILIAIMIVASGATAVAQNNSSPRLSREELATKQAQYIAHELALDESTTNKYVETYCQYQREIWALGPRKGLTTEQRLDRSQKILDLPPLRRRSHSRRHQGVHRLPRPHWAAYVHGRDRP